MMAEIDTRNPPEAERPPQPPAAPPAAGDGPSRPAPPTRPRPSFLDALMRALGPIHT